MGCENTLYECCEHKSIALARSCRYISLLLMFLSTLIGGILLINTFEPSSYCPPSYNAQGLGILLIILSCCTCTQTFCYFYDAKQIVHRTSTQEIGDLPSTSGIVNEKEVFGGVDVGHKACAGLSSCWQLCGFLSCFGIGLALMTGINADGTVIIISNTTGDTNTTGSGDVNGGGDIERPTNCDGQTLFTAGFIVVIVSLLFFVTMCWRICRDPQTMEMYRQTLLPSRVGNGDNGSNNIDDTIITEEGIRRASSVELTLQ